MKSTKIEGENLDPEQVRSSIARHLGLDAGGTVVVDRDVEGPVEMMLDATQNFAAPLTHDRLFAWHAALFPTGRSNMRKIIVGAWRDDATGPMQVVSGPASRQRVHYEAPAAPRLPSEMAQYLDWANTVDRTDAVLCAALAHLWFVTIHPFDDGNGRIARARSQTGSLRARRTARSVSTACRRRLTMSATTTSTSWSAPRKARSM